MANTTLNEKDADVENALTLNPWIKNDNFCVDLITPNNENIDLFIHYLN